MVTKDRFLKSYPLSLMEAATTISIAWHGWLPVDPDLPAPTVKGSKSFLMFCGATDSAVRTAFSRARKNGDLYFYQDETGTERFDMTPIGQDLNHFYRQPPSPEDGLTLAVFRFTSGQDKQRYILKEILKNFGFQMLTQNVYAAGRIPLEPLETVVEREGLSGNLFLFPQPRYPEGKTLDRIAETFQSKEWSDKAIQFREELEIFFNAVKDDTDSFHRGLYAAAAHHIHIKIHLPPLPSSIFPGLEKSKEAENRITAFFIQYWDAHRSVYYKLNGGTA